MSYRGPHPLEGYFSYVMPPLEGLWWQEGAAAPEFSHKEEFCWISMIRLPDFVKQEDFDWAVKEASAKKGGDFSEAEFFSYREGTCVQCMHIGSYDEEPETLRRMDAFAAEQGYVPDFSGSRYHHEIYLSNPQRTAPEKLRTVIRHPVKLP